MAAAGDRMVREGRGHRAAVTPDPTAKGHSLDSGDSSPHSNETSRPIRQPPRAWNEHVEHAGGLGERTSPRRFMAGGAGLTAAARRLRPQTEGTKGPPSKIPAVGGQPQPGGKLGTGIHESARLVLCPPVPCAPCTESSAST